MGREGTYGDPDGKTIVLIVDDDPDLARLAAITLGGLVGLRVEVRHQPFGLLNTIAELKPSLVVLDVMMPAVDGEELTRLVREDPEIGTTQILLFSALEEADLRERTRTCGADGYIAKTGGAKALADEVRRRLGV